MLCVFCVHVSVSECVMMAFQSMSIIAYGCIENDTHISS